MDRISVQIQTYAHECRLLCFRFFCFVETTKIDQNISRTEMKMRKLIRSTRNDEFVYAQTQLKCSIFYARNIK